ncbi:hypothetical protein C7387_4314 [Yokenella regensburgei]|uniref:ClpX-type ZB domain-containing protein n=1 Tax=Yokenella regensburgei TaxID=158877 RepID=A0ABX9RWE1_9ENTR|nr:hypothetical protein [Yokenella regensburgei]RKR53174.1 hypothetical protein C7387_4314 [Yokenella regensburgei]VFS16143.1 Uncharacterised protein [Yokenella regensburgei]VFS33751.1 Uncharacterised protein [Yokenella regensburgei]
MAGMTFMTGSIGFQEYQPDPEDLCSLCGGNFGKESMIEGKDKIHICMECVELLGEIKKERVDKKLDSIKRELATVLFNDANCSTAEALRIAGFVIASIAADKIKGIALE